MSTETTLKNPFPPQANLCPPTTEAERKTIEKLRNRGGWWNGDQVAASVLREFAEQVRSESKK